jgi:hypothetical protein
MEKLFDIGVDLMLPIFSSTILKSIDELQKAQDPPYSDGIFFIEVRKQFILNSGLFSLVTPVVSDPLFAVLFRNSAFYANQDATKYSMRRINDQYTLFSEMIQMQYPGYTLDSDFLMECSTDTSIDLVDLKKLLVSKNLDHYNSVKDHFFGKQAKFLDRKPINSITYATYPRSGNTFLRKYFEGITGIATGSDMVMKYNLNVSLQYTGFKGEGIVDDRIWINKSHFPVRMPYDHYYDTQAIMVCVRNPLDVFVSGCILLASMTHNKSINEKVEE